MEGEAKRLFQHLEEGEHRKKKAKTNESGGESKASAWSSGPAPPEGEVPRSRGGVPMAADSGDSAPEIAKRKIGDSEPEDGEDQRDKKSKTGEER